MLPCAINRITEAYRGFNCTIKGLAAELATGMKASENRI
jgi:hypothetical protein